MKTFGKHGALSLFILSLTSVNASAVTCPASVQKELDSFVKGVANGMIVQGQGGWAVKAQRRLVDGTPCVGKQAGGFAKSIPDGIKSMTTTTYTPIASVSKVITAVALLDILKKKGISVKAGIGRYLPITWQQGAGVSTITFHELLRHESGLPVTEVDNTEQLMMWLKGGVTKPKTHAYNNAGYVLLQELFANIQEPARLLLGNFSTQTAGWLLEDYVRKNYLSKITTGPGLLKPTCVYSPTIMPFAYPKNSTLITKGRSLLAFGYEAKGYHGCGTGRWNFSTETLNDFMEKLHNGKFIPKTLATQMEANFYGWHISDSGVTPKGAKYVGKAGNIPGGEYQFKSRAVIFPNDTIVTLLVNSKMDLGPALRAAWDARVTN